MRFAAGWRIILLFAVPWCLLGPGPGEPLAFAGSGNPYPYELEGGVEAGLLLTAAAAFGLGWWQGRDVQPFIPEQVGVMHPDQVNSFDRPATRNWSPGAARASDWLVHGQMVAPLTLNLDGTGGLQPLKTTLIQAETMALSGGLTYLLKSTFKRSRPLVFNRDPRIPDHLRTSLTARRSFPSGHTANAFAAMVMLGSMHEKFNPDSGAGPWVWAGCLGSAAVTGIFRVTGGWHFTSDVLAGAALGSLVGWLVPRMHEIDGQQAAPGSGGLSLSYGFRF